MWQSQTHKDKKTSTKKKDNKNLIHIKRMDAEIEMIDAAATSTNATPQAAPSTFPKEQIRIILNDLNPQKAEIFAPHSIVVGQEIFLGIDKPMKIHIKAKVLWCEQYGANSHILSSQPFTYRLGIEFLLSNDEEKKMMQDFCGYIKKRHLNPPAIAA